ncbi:MAG TPA: DUF6057 family protein [Sedimentisphaerales bacterium]|nr:DUF6057 family protein [Sedimentisphaerales bacterium]HQI27732.1 DUF6057 family protein [Sedimentisphaerales bacterium]
MTTAQATKGNPSTKGGWLWSVLHRLPPVVFYLLLYVYLAVEVELHLLYHGGGLIDNFPTFYLDWEFFTGQFACPGGIVEYIGAFLAQFFYYSWVGAAIVTCQGWMIALGTDIYLKDIGASRLRIFRFVGPLILAAVYSQYVFHFVMTLAFTVAVIAAVLFMRFRPSGVVGRALCFLALSLVLYVGTGAAYLLFAFLYIGGAILKEGRYREGLGYGVSAVFVPGLIGAVAWGLPLLDAYVLMLPIHLGTRVNEPPRLMLKVIGVLYLFLPLTVGGVGLWRLIMGRRMSLPKSPSGRVDRKSRKLSGLTMGFVSGLLKGAIEPILVAVAATAILRVYHDSNLKALFEVDYYSQQRMWSQVLDTAGRSPPHYLICHAVNRALYHIGRLGDEMFKYYQDPKALLLTGKEALWQKIDTCMDLGLINEAENALTISVEVCGERPVLLQRLARIYLVKGDVETASVYLRALSKVPFWKSRAKEDLAQLNCDPNVSTNEEVQRLRAIRLRQDFVRQTDFLRQLLIENPRNRMAYEYGAAWLLLTKNLAGFVQLFNAYHHNAESRVPRHYEEALLLAKALNIGGVDLDVRSISQQSRDRFVSFVRARQSFGQDTAVARQSLRGTFGDTYYYHFFFSDFGVR